MFCRVIASCYQIFTFNKYRTGCLHFQPDENSRSLLVRQVRLQKFDDSDVDDIVMLATFFVMLVIFPMYLIGHQHLKLVSNLSQNCLKLVKHLVSNINVTVYFILTDQFRHNCLTLIAIEPLTTRL